MQTTEATPIFSTQTSIHQELGLSGGISQAIQNGQRHDFALLVAMFSGDLSETTPVEVLPNQETETLRQQFSVPEPQVLSANEESYSRSAFISQQFHQGGMHSAHLSAQLCPDALTYPSEKAHGLGEEVYSNLSYHSRRQLDTVTETALSSYHLYHELSQALRKDQLRHQA